MTVAAIPTRTYLEDRLLRSLYVTQTFGYTVREFLLDVPTSHHGQVSSLFSDLHRAEVIECLQQRRSDYCVYVLPKHRQGRSTRTHASVARLSRQERLLAKAEGLDFALRRYGVGDDSPVGAAAAALLDEINRQYR